MASAVVLEVPDSTVTTTATVFSTRFVTVPLSTVTAPAFSYSPQSSSPPPLSNLTTSASSTSTSTSTTSTSDSTTSTDPTLLQTVIPVPATSSTSSTSSISSTSSTPATTTPSTSSTITSSTSSTSSTSAIPSTTSSTSSSSPSSTGSSTPDSLIGDQSLNNTQKRAIVGGLSGSIAGLLFIAFLIFLILRKRRNIGFHDNEKAGSISDEGCRPAFLRTLTTLTGGKGSPKHVSVTERCASPASVDEEHRIIRMSTRHWLRPFAPGAGEGYRESAPRGQLHVVNPDTSRPGTPKGRPESPGAFLKRQRSGLTGFVFGAYSTPAQNYRGQISRPIPQRIPSGFPTITVIDPNRSREGISRPQHAQTPSFSSYPSVRTSPVRPSSEHVRRQTPDDPFVSDHTLPQQHTAADTPRAQNRPSTSSTGGAASTWSSLLHPFRGNNGMGQHSHIPRSNIPSSHLASQYSTTSGVTASRRSDPFDLDYRSSHYYNSPRVPPQGSHRFPPPEQQNQVHRSPTMPHPLFHPYHQQRLQQQQRERERRQQEQQQQPQQHPPNERQRNHTPNWTVFPYSGT